MKKNSGYNNQKKSIEDCYLCSLQGFLSPCHRMGKPPTSESSQSSERPLTIKDSDLRALDDDKDDTGWAGAQEEVDYDAKLKFDESDDSEEEFPVKVSSVSKLGKETRSDTRTKSPAKSADRTNDEVC